jgi:elongation factor Ts
MKVSAQVIKELRTRTDAGMLDCKDALVEAGGDAEKAVEILKSRGLAIAEKKRERSTGEGIIESYIHHTNRVGALVELNCETDFVAHTNEFKKLAHDLAMQVAATAPQFITAAEMPPETSVDPQIACLLDQASIREPDKTVEEIISEVIAKVGENIRIRRFARFELGC